MMRLYCVLLLAFLTTGVSFSQIKQVTLKTSRPAQYERVDIDVELTSSWKNPFLQEDISLDMLITSPSGKQLFLPCFYESGESGKLSLWKSRFAPQETGRYQYSFRMKKNGKVRSTSKVQEFVVVGTHKRGFLHTKDNWTLRFDNGTPFRGIGENICWESRDNDDSKFFKELHEMADRYNYDYLLTEFAANGGNFFRTWICSWNLPIDYKGPFNNSRYAVSGEFYNPSAVARMDHLVQLSESLDLYIMLTLGQGGYREKDGGVATSDADFFSNPKAKERYKNRLRYIVARWGYSPSIAMWEFFNEVDNVQFRDSENPIDGKLIVEWHKEMSAYLKGIDPYGHIVTTSISHRDIDGLNSIPDIDINQKHIYKNTSDIPSTILSYTEDYGKPYIIGECGYEWDWSLNFDDFASGMDMDFKRCLWFGVFLPTPVTPMSWWWEYFDARNMTSYFRGVREISDRMLTAGGGSFEPVTIKAGKATAFGVRCGEEIYLYLFNPEHATSIIDVEIEAVGKPYRVQSYEPTGRVYKDVSNVVRSASSITLKQTLLGAKNEILYILSPTK